MSDPTRQVFQSGSDCPDLDQLFEEMQLSPADPRHIAAERHLAACSHCRTEWSLFRQFEAGEVRPEERDAVDFIMRKGRAQRAAVQREQTAADLRSFWQRLPTPAWIGGAALAMATLVIAIGITAQWRVRHAPLNDYGDNQTLRSQLVEITTPLTGIGKPPTTIQWKRVHGAAHYAVSVKEVDGSEVFYTKVTESALSVPPAVSKLLAQGRTLILAVTASDSSARPIARSGTVKIHLKSN